MDEYLLKLGVHAEDKTVIASCLVALSKESVAFILRLLTEPGLLDIVADSYPSDHPDYKAHRDLTLSSWWRNTAAVPRILDALALSESPSNIPPDRREVEIGPNGIRWVMYKDVLFDDGLGIVVCSDWVPKNHFTALSI